MAQAGFESPFFLRSSRRQPPLAAGPTCADIVVRLCRAVQPRVMLCWTLVHTALHVGAALKLPARRCSHAQLLSAYFLYWHARTLSVPHTYTHPHPLLHTHTHSRVPELQNQRHTPPVPENLTACLLCAELPKARGHDEQCDDQMMALELLLVAA